VASPFPSNVPKNDDELIVPAREGALRVLRVARDAGVKRVVLTSSFAAIGYGHPPQNTPFNETSWTDLTADGLTAYVKSKTITERAAWDFIAREGGNLGAFGRQSGGRLRPSPWARLFDFDSHRAAHDGWRRARPSEALLWRGRCSRCRRLAHPRDDMSRR